MFDFLFGAAIFVVGYIVGWIDCDVTRLRRSKRQAEEDRAAQEEARR